MIFLFGIIITLLIIPDFAPVHRYGDVSTYYMEIDSIVHDLNIKYEEKDIERAISNRFDDLPAGLILVKNGNGDLFYGKEFTYPLAASPFFLMLGRNGIIFFNSIMFLMMIYLGYRYLRLTNSNVVALMVAGLFFLLSTAYIYTYWLSPEIYNTFLIMVGLFLWFSYLNKKDLNLQGDRTLYLSAMILGLATFAKTPNFVCILPLIAFEAYFKNYKQIAKITIAFLFTTLILFGINYGVTGNLTLYGHQYYYVSKYPFLEGCDANCSLPPEGNNVIGDLIKPSILSFSGLRWFGYNIFYYFFGRFTGAIWYYPFILLSIFSVLISAYNYTIHNRRFLVGHSNLNLGRMLLPIIVISYILIYIYLSYDNWPINYFGGQGAIGNRYFYILVMSIW